MFRCYRKTDGDAWQETRTIESLWSSSNFVRLLSGEIVEYQEGVLMTMVVPDGATILPFKEASDE